MPEKISSRSREVAEKIRDREPFETYGALKAETVNGLSVWDSGRLSGADEGKFREDCSMIRYVVYSYGTPIAWWRPGDLYGWHKVAQKFSVTTSHHQGNLYLIDRHRTEVTPVGDPAPGTPSWRSECRDCGTVLKLHGTEVEAIRHASEHGSLV